MQPRTLATVALVIVITVLLAILLILDNKGPEHSGSDCPEPNPSAATPVYCF
jgi:hypothetical protein